MKLMGVIREIEEFELNSELFIDHSNALYRKGYIEPLHAPIPL